MANLVSPSDLLELILPEISFEEKALGLVIPTHSATQQFDGLLSILSRPSQFNCAEEY